METSPRQLIEMMEYGEASVGDFRFYFKIFLEIFEKHDKTDKDQGDKVAKLEQEMGSIKNMMRAVFVTAITAGLSVVAWVIKHWS